MYDTGSTQQMYGLWVKSKQAWMRDTDGSIAMFGKRQAEDLAHFNNDLTLKDVFICSRELMEDQLFESFKKQWLERLEQSNYVINVVTS